MREQTVRAGFSAGLTIIRLIAATIGAVATAGFLGVAPAAAEGELVVETMANGQPADSAPGPMVESGATVNIRYVITVGSTEPLYDFVVTNETGGAQPNCDIDNDGQPDGTNVYPGARANGESFVCVASVVAGDPSITYATVGRVTAYDFDVTATFVHDDAAHYTTISPTTTQAPTTTVPATAAPTTTTPTTAATSTTTTEPPTSSTSSTTASTLTSTSSPPTSSASPTTETLVTEAPAGEQAAPPDELAARDHAGGVRWWWIVLAFAAGGAVAAGASSGLTGKNAAVPDQ